MILVHPKFKMICTFSLLLLIKLSIYIFFINFLVLDESFNIYFYSSSQNSRRWNFFPFTFCHCLLKQESEKIYIWVEKKHRKRSEGLMRKPIQKKQRCEDWRAILFIIAKFKISIIFQNCYSNSRFFFFDNEPKIILDFGHTNIILVL